MGEPKDPGSDRAERLTLGLFLVKVDRYGSVSGLVRVRTPLGFLVVVPSSNEAGSFEPVPLE